MATVKADPAVISHDEVFLGFQAQDAVAHSLRVSVESLGDVRLAKQQSVDEDSFATQLDGLAGQGDDSLDGRVFAWAATDDNEIAALIGIEVVEPTVQQEAVWVRRRAAKALVPVESKAAIPVLFEALEDENYLVRQYAEEALKRMGIGEMVYFRP